MADLSLSGDSTQPTFIERCAVSGLESAGLVSLNIGRDDWDRPNEATLLLSPAEARLLAKHLTDTARNVEEA